MQHQISFASDDCARLMLVATPIGNLQDMSLRAIETLQNADRIYAEDTRVSQKLLIKYNIQKPLYSYHNFNEHFVSDVTAEEMKLKKLQVALITDAGLPVIADPGVSLIKACLQRNINVTAVGVNCAYLHAYICGGIYSSTVVFHGFITRKSIERWNMHETWAQNYQAVHIAYQSPRRLLATIAEINAVSSYFKIKIPQMAVCKELTKKHEQFFRGKATEVGNYLKNNEELLKGEFTLVVQYAAWEKMQTEEDVIRQEITTWINKYKMRTKDAISLASRVYKQKKNYLTKMYYEWLNKEK